MKKTNKGSRTNPHNPQHYWRKRNRKEANNMVNTQALAWHDAQTNMMHDRFREAWHGKVQQTILQIKWSSICNELHIDKTPQAII